MYSSGQLSIGQLIDLEFELWRKEIFPAIRRYKGPNLSHSLDDGADDFLHFAARQGRALPC